MTPLGLEATRLPERAEQGWEALTCGRGELTATAGARGPGRRNSRRVMPRSGGRAAPGAGKGDARAPGAGLAARLLLRAGPGGRGFSRQLVGLRKRSSWRKKRGGWAAPRVQQRRSPHGAQRALLDHRTPSILMGKLMALLGNLVLVPVYSRGIYYVGIMGVQMYYTCLWCL